MRFFLSLLALITLATLSACTPADEQYCQRYGVGGTPEFGKCLDYFHQQQAAFNTDYGQCATDADQVYPPTLYDYGHYEHVMGGWNGVYYGGETIRVEPDYQHNLEVDRLRLRIIAPCMDSKGWNSPSSWQAGRHPVTAVKSKPLPPQPLPWLGSSPLVEKPYGTDTLPWQR